MSKFLFNLNLALFCVITVLGQTSMEKVQKMAEFFVSAYNAKNYAQIEQRFNAQMKAAVPPEKLAKFAYHLLFIAHQLTSGKTYCTSAISAKFASFSTAILPKMIFAFLTSTISKPRFFIFSIVSGDFAVN